MSKKHNGPPPFSLRLIQWLCKDELSEEIEGNLHEYHKKLTQSFSSKSKYWFQVVTYLRPSTLKLFKPKARPMFIFNPALTLRNLYRHKSTAFINIFGFTTGLVAAIFLYFYIYSEVNYDSFHSNKDQIYRVARMSEMNGSPYSIGVTSGPFARALENDFSSDITSSTRVQAEDGLVTVGDAKFFEEEMLFVDANFFEFFSFPLIVGDPSTVLQDANSVVLTQEAAKKFFGDKSPLGEILVVDNEYQFTVSGIIGELPAKSHLEFEMVFSIQLFERFDWFSDWWNNSLLTYVSIATPEQAANVEEQLGGFMQKYFAEDFAESGNKIDLKLEPLSDLYFNRDTRYDEAKHGNLQSIYILAFVAIAILFIACFNYVNLSIAQSFMRAKEVGVRKVLGVRRARLVLQFLGESMMILLFSIVLSVGICHLLNPVFNAYFQLEVTLNWMDGNVITFFSALIVLVLLTSGVYPAILLSTFKPVSVLKGSKLASGKSAGLRKGLVIIQFSIAIFLMVATLLISAQTDFLSAKDLGFDREAVILVDLNNSEIRSQQQSFKDQLMTHASVKQVSSMSGEPGGFHDASSFKVTGIDVNQRMRTAFADRNYLDLFDIEIVAGRNFSEEITSDEEDAMIFNEQAVLELGLAPEEAVGRKATMPGWGIEDATIIGVVSDFHFNSLKDQIEPLAIISGHRHRKLAIKVNASDIAASLFLIDEEYQKLSPDFPISYEFLDKKLARQYEDERKQAKVFTVFSGISIFLASLGIFGLAAYVAHQRQKELGIRKVLGATVKQIIGLISKEFVVLVFIASIVATPAAWFFIEQWLSDFAYRINVFNHWYVFLLSGIVAVFIALLTVIFKTYRAAVSNPTESIRNE